MGVIGGSSEPCASSASTCVGGGVAEVAGDAAAQPQREI